jgi:lysozyme family protein
MNRDPVFEAAVAGVLAHEGGWSDHPDDAGGRTRYGLSSRTYPDLDLDALTVEDAKAIYFRDFWIRFGIHRLPGVTLPGKILDLAANMGPRAAILCLQRALRATGTRVLEDGVIGPQTLGAVKGAPAEALMAALRSEAAGYYRELVARDHRRLAFIRGWEARAYA